MWPFISAKKYSIRERTLTREDIRRLVSQSSVRTLDQSQEDAVETAITERRRGDSQISLQQIYDCLLSLEQKRVISRHDRDGLMRVFQTFFG